MKPNPRNARSLLRVVIVVALGLLPFAFAGSNAPPPVPLGLPAVPFPANNPSTPAKIELGEKLFFEPGLSVDKTVSCASCHRPDHFFTDEAALSKGVRAQLGDHNAMTVLNAAYAPHLLWDGRSLSLEDQVRYPVTHPREMNNTQEGVVKFLAADSVYPALFKQAFGDEAVSWERVTQAIATFERTLLAGNSPFDRFMAGNTSAVPEAARRGFELFRGNAGCAKCHQYDEQKPFFTDFDFHNTGVNWSQSTDLGRYSITKAREDKGAFRTPSLRNVAKTGPYMHDGKMTSLHEVVEFYSRGGEKNPFLDEKIHPLNLSEQDKSDLVAFLESLTGEMTYTPHTVSAADKSAASNSAPSSKDGSALLPKSYPPFGRVEVIAGTSDFGDGGDAKDALFIGVGGLAVDSKGNLFLADSGGNQIRKIDTHTGIITTIAGNGLLFNNGESKLATDQALHGPAPLAIDPESHYLYVGEIVGRHVQRVDLRTGTMDDLGTPKGGFGEPDGLAWSSTGLLVADGPRGQIWKLGSDGNWTGLLPDAARLRGGVRAVAEDSHGDVYLVEYFSHRVLRWDPENRRLDTAAGTGEAGRVADGAQATQSPLRTPDGIAFDRDGNLVISDKGNHRICRVDFSTGRLKTLVEAGQQGTEERWTPGSIAFDAAGTLFMGDIQRNRVLRYSPGAAAPVVIAGTGDIRDGGPATAARFAHVGAVTSDAKGTVYISDTLHHRVRAIDPETGRIRTVAGTGISGYNGDGIAASSAWLSYPGKLQVDSLGRLYIGDYYNNRVRRVDPRTGLISTVVGNGNAGEDGDDGPADNAPLLNPHALLLEADRLLVIASAVSSKLRWVDLSSGQIHAVPVHEQLPETLVFYGVTSWNGGLVLASPRPGSIDFLKDGKISKLFGRPEVVFPQDVAVSPKGDLYICETGRNRVLKWDGTHLDVVVENLGRPRSISFDRKGNLLIADTFHNRVLRVWAESQAPTPSVAAGKTPALRAPLQTQQRSLPEAELSQRP